MEQRADFRWRVVAALRPAALALVIANALTIEGDRPWWWLVALAGIAAAAALAERLPGAQWRWAVEMAAAAVLVGLSPPDTLLTLPYLLLPGFLAGLRAGVAGSLFATGIAGLATLAGAVLGSGLAVATPFTDVLVPWLALILAAGLIGAWTARQRPPREQDVERYESAYRLLSELRVVSRQLSAGLDPVSLAQGVLANAADQLGSDRAALLVRSEGGVLLPLARRSADERWLAEAERDPAVLEAWAAQSAVVEEVDGGQRVVVPLRVGLRTIGALVADVAGQVEEERLRPVAADADTGALRLETALLFDEVRELATQEERRRLAREIHDGIAQELASIGYLIDDLAASNSEPETRERVAGLREELTRIVSDLRLSIFDLRSDVTPDTTLGGAVSDYARRIGASSGMTVHLMLEESPRRLRAAVEAELLRVVQEAVTNVRKHAGARNLWVRVAVDAPTAEVTVEDDGRGLGDRRTDSFGMDIMSERSRRIGAGLTVSDRPGGGTVVHIALGGD